MIYLENHDQENIYHINQLNVFSNLNEVIMLDEINQKIDKLHKLLDLYEFGGRSLDIDRFGNLQNELLEKLGVIPLVLDQERITINDLLIVNNEKLKKMSELMENENDYSILTDAFEIKFHELMAEIDLLIEQERLLDERFDDFFRTKPKIDGLQLRLLQLLSKLHERLLELSRNKVEKYKEGPKKRASTSQKNWALAREYFIEEIPKHSTLKKARKTAANRAGIVVEERQLVKMLPDPR